MVRGKYANFSYQKVAGFVQKSIADQQRFWRDTSAFPSVVTLIDAEGSSGGLYRRAGIVSYFDENDSFDRLKLVYAHEFVHHWTKNRIRLMWRGHQWFSEGFTDYYAHKILLKNKSMDLAKFLNRFNKILRKHYTSLVRKTPNDSITYDGGG